jgi:hypothetical protein
MAVAAAALLVLPGIAQAATEYQIDGPNPAPTGAYLTAGGPDLSAINGSTSVAVSIPFNFQLYGVSYSSVMVVQSGLLVFAGYDHSLSSNTGIPHSPYSYEPSAFIAPWWDNLTRSGATIRSQVFGTAPARKLVIEWQNVVYAGSATRFSFEVQLFERTHQIRLAYGPTGPATASASVGVQGSPNDAAAWTACTSPSSGSCSPADFPANRVIDFLLPPDLRVGSVSADPAGYAGVPFHSSALLVNSGGRLASQARVRFFLGTSSTFDPSAPGLGESSPVELASGDQQRVTAIAPIPAGTLPGNYFLFAKADPDGAIAEPNEEDNLSVPLPFKVGPAAPDLVVSSLSGPSQAVSGATLPIARVFRNAGNAAATAVQYTYFLSDNPVVSYSDRVIPPVNWLHSPPVPRTVRPMFWCCPAICWPENTGSGCASITTLPPPRPPRWPRSAR